MNPGLKLITVCFIFMYALPLFSNTIFLDKIPTSYKVYPVTANSLGSLGAVYTVFLLLYFGKVRLFPRVSSVTLRGMVLLAGRVYLRVRLIVANATLAVALTVFMSGAGDYRYTSGGLMQTGSPLVFIMMLIEVCITVDMIYCMFIRQEERISILSKRYLENILLSLGLMLGANGTASMFQALFISFYSFFPKTFRRLVFVPKRRLRPKSFILALGAAVVVVFIFPLAWISGETIKGTAGQVHVNTTTYASKAAEVVESTYASLENYFYYLISATSSYYYSLLFTSEESRDVLSHERASPILYPLTTFFYRGDALLGGLFKIPRPEISSLSRLNHVLLTREDVGISPRTGTSPGLIGSFNYAFIFPFNILFCALYISWIARAIDILVGRHTSQTLSIFGSLLLFVFLLFIFQSPIDFIVIFDTTVISIFILLAVYYTHWDPSTVWRDQRMQQGALSRVASAM